MESLGLTHFIRKIVLVILVLNLYVLMCFSGVGAQLADTPWPVFHGDLNHTGRSPYLGTQTNETKWITQLSGFTQETSPAIGPNGTIYLGSYASWKVYAVYPNGTLKWSYFMGNSPYGAIYSSPAVDSEGVIYVGSYNNNLYALYPNGSVKWTYLTGGPVNSAPIISSDGTIYVGSDDDKLYAFYPNGTVKWTYTIAGNVHSSPAIGYDGIIYFQGNWPDDKLYALYPNGTLKWSSALGGGVSSPSIGSDGTIYLTSFYSAKTYAVYPNGTKKWEYSTGSSVTTPAIGLDDSIYFGEVVDDKVYSLYPNGTLKWSYTTGGEVRSAPVIGSDGTIYIGSYDKKLYAFDEKGNVKWTYTTADMVTSSPAIDSDGTVYLGAGAFDRNLYAFRDMTPPAINLVSPTPPNGTVLFQDWVYINITSSETLSTAILEWNGVNETMTQGSWYKNKTTLSPGVYTYRVYANDTLGNLNVSEKMVVSIAEQTITIESSTGTGSVEVSTDSGGFIGFENNSLESFPQLGLPPNATFPHGLFSFNITNITNGSSVTLTIMFPDYLRTNLVEYWKYNASSGSWYQIPVIDTNIGDNIIQITLTDGGLGDSDGLANGVISDPGGPVVPFASVPALTPIGIAVLSGLGGVIGLKRVKRKSK